MNQTEAKQPLAHTRPAERGRAWSVPSGDDAACGIEPQAAPAGPAWERPGARPGNPLPLARGKPRIAIISSCWHEDIVSNGIAAMRAEFERGGISGTELQHFTVPGAFEIPLHAKRLANSKQFDAIIACGFVVNGGIYRHEFVAAAVIDGLMRVQLDTDVPVFSAVLTPRDFHDHEEHQSFFHAHFEKKGVEVARACMATMESLCALPI